MSNMLSGMAVAWAPVTILCAIGVLAWVPWAINRWRFRHIPGPFAPPVLGNLLGLAQHDLHGYLEICRNKYGKLFKIYIGSNMIVCLADPALARRACSSLMCRHSGIQLVTGEQDWDFLKDGLAGAHGSAWRTLRAAWAPAFNTSAMESYAGAMNTCALELVERLRPAAASGHEVELVQELGAMTLHVVGQAAYGVDLHSITSPPRNEDPTQAAAAAAGRAGCSQQQQQQKHSQQLQQHGGLFDAIKAVFQGGGITNSSNYLPFVLLFPALGPLIAAAAYHYPDAKLARLAQARKVIRQVSLQLVTNWRRKPNSQHPEDAKTHPPAGMTNCTVGSITTATPNPTPATSGPKTSGGPGGLGFAGFVPGAPGTFPAAMLNAQDKETGEALTDEQVVAQFNTFLVAAFETTASAIAGCIYYIAQHPGVEAQLLQEVDGFGWGRQVTHHHLGQFPYVSAIIKETLRLLAPGAIATRITEQHYQLTPEVLLPPQTPLFACIHCYQRDPDYWPAAEQFRPERWLTGGCELQPCQPDAYSPFGIGPRLCVGMKFANQEVAIVLIKLYQHYCFELQPGQVPLPMKLTFALIPQGLRVRVHSRSSSSTAS